MNSDLSAIAVLLPQPLLDRLDHLRQSRNLSSIQEALLIVLSEYFANQPNSPKASAGNVSQMEARLSRTEALLAALSDRMNYLEGRLPLGGTAKQPPQVSIASDFDDIEDEPDEVLHSFLEPERSLRAAAFSGAPFRETAKQLPEHQIAADDAEAPPAAEEAAEKAIAFGRNLGWMIQPDGKAQPLTYEEIEEEPDEILYDFLEPG